MYRIEMFNLSRREVFVLPAEHSDWTEACTEGQQYIFNRRAENAEILYFRVVDSCNFIPEEKEEKETEYCNGVCFACPDTAKCEAYCSLNRGDCSTCSKLGDCDNIDPSYLAREPKYFEGLLVQKMIEEMNRSFDSNSNV